MGNVRYTFNKHPVTGLLQPLQADNYYAFGLRKSLSAGPNQYLYNGKELQEELGQLDYGARFYDPLIGRWSAVDPLAEKSRRWSPYTYGKNNPIIMIDPDGMFDVHINGPQAVKAKDELQKSVQGQLNLSRDSKTGNITYTQVKGAKLDANAQQLVNAIDDHTVDIRVNAGTNTKDIVGGAFYGNTVTKGPNGNTVVANQEVNPSVLNAISTYYGKPGSGMLHEVTEAYQGAKLSQATGVSSPIGSGKPGNVYPAAHKAATPQPGPVTSKVTDSQGNFLSAPYPNASWVIWVVSDGVKEPAVVQQLPVPKTGQ